MEQKLKQPAWEEFLAVCRVLKRYNALEDQQEPPKVPPMDKASSRRLLGLRTIPKEICTIR